MTDYPDHTRIAQTLLDQQTEINQLRETLGAADLEHRADQDKLRELLATECRRSAAAIEREETAEEAAEEANRQLDSAYRERAHLVALLAATTDGAVIAPAPDVDEPGWQIAYLTIGGRQASWHIAPRDADLFARIAHVPADDPRARWDGHTTEQKYARIAALLEEPTP